MHRQHRAKPRSPSFSDELSRREWLKGSASAAALSAAISWPMDAVAQSQDPSAAVLDRLVKSSLRADRRMLIKDATVITLDSSVGDLLHGNILIHGKKIVAVGPEASLQGGDENAIVVAAEGIIAIPGMVDCHRHAWEGQIRGIIPNSSSIDNYMSATHRGFAPFYRPDDMYLGNIATALGCIDAGITCLIDNSHNSRSSAHSDAAVQALFDSGIRAVHASGAPTFGDWDRQWPEDIPRLQKQFFNAEDQLVTLRLFSRGLVKEDWQTAERLGLWISIDGAGGPNSAKALSELRSAGLVNERRTFNHGNALPQESWAIIREAGITINVCPRSDSQWALGSATMGLQDALSNGIRPGLSVDNDTAFSTDLFTEMRVASHIAPPAVGDACCSDNRPTS